MPSTPFGSDCIVGTAFFLMSSCISWVRLEARSGLLIDARATLLDTVPKLTRPIETLSLLMVVVEGCAKLID